MCAIRIAFARRIDVVTRRKIYAPASDNFSVYQYRGYIVSTPAAVAATTTDRLSPARIFRSTRGGDFRRAKIRPRAKSARSKN